LGWPNTDNLFERLENQEIVLEGKTSYSLSELKSALRIMYIEEATVLLMDKTRKTLE